MRGPDVGQAATVGDGLYLQSVRSISLACPTWIFSVRLCAKKTTQFELIDACDVIFFVKVLIR